MTFLPIYLQSVRGLSPGEVGLKLLPLSVGGGIGGLTAGRLMTAKGWSTPLAGAAGGAAASVRYARTLGEAVATTRTGGVLFGALTLAHPDAAALFVRLVREGPAVPLPSLDPGARAPLQGAQFRLGFAVPAALAAAGSVLAWRVPVRRV